MKKLYLSITLIFIFILMFAVTLIPTQAFTFNNEDSPAGITLDTIINELNGYTLREVFENNRIAQADTFIESDSLGSYNDGVYTNTSSGTTSSPYFFNYIENTTDTFYYRFSLYTNSDASTINYISVYRGVGTQNINNPEQYKPYSLSFLGIPTHNFILFRTYYYQTVQGEEFVLNVKDYYIVNLTTLGLSNTKDELDYYYTIYYLLNNGIDPTTLYADYYTEGQIYGYSEGYADGYLDGEEQGLLDGYNVGYNEGMDYAATNNITLLSVFQLIIGVVMSMLGFIINIELFGISIASVLGTLAIGIAIIWTLKLIRG